MMRPLSATFPEVSAASCMLTNKLRSAQNNLKSALFSILVRVLWQPWSWLCDCLYIYTLYILMWSQVQSNFDLCPVTPAHSLQLLQVSLPSWERDCRHNCRVDRIYPIYIYIYIWYIYIETACRHNCRWSGLGVGWVAVMHSSESLGYVAISFGCVVMHSAI